MKKTLLPLLLCASALTLAGCNFLSPSSGSKSKKKKSSSEDTQVTSDDSSNSESLTSNDGPNISISGSTPTATTTGGSTTTNTNTSTTSGGSVSYTAASAINAVCELLSTQLGQTVTATHDSDGDWWAGNFGDSTSWDDLKGLAEVVVPTGFVADGTWASDTFQDGTPVDFLDYYWNNEIYIEYCVYTVSEGGDYDGNYLQIDAGTVNA